MKQFRNILSFELSAYLKNKVFMSVTIVLILVTAGLLSFPRIAELFRDGGDGESSEHSQGTGDTEDTEDGDGQWSSSMLLVDNHSQDKHHTLSFLQLAMPDREIVLAEADGADPQSLVSDGTYDGALILHSPISYTYIIETQGVYENATYELDEILRGKYRIQTLEALGIDGAQVNEILETQVSGTVIQTGTDQKNNFMYTYVLIFGLYMAILLYGQLVATSVASEKSSRAMELLVTSASSNSLMFGKVFASALAGLIQMAVVLITSFVSFNLNKSYWEGNTIIESLFNMPVDIMLYTVLFFLLGFFVYAFMYGAVGSLASKVEDINTSSMPITLVFVGAFLVVMFSMTSGSVDSTLMVVASYVPFTSPMAMFVRIAMGNVAAYEIVISVVILILSTLGIGYLAAKIYRVGVLLYGKPPKLWTILKEITRKTT